MGNLIASPSTVTSTDQVHRARVWVTIALSLVFIIANKRSQSLNQTLNQHGHHSILSFLTNRPLNQQLNQRLLRFDPLTLVTSSLLFSYILKHLSLLLHLNAPITSLSTEPDMHYSASFSRARHFLNAWDAAILSTHHLSKYNFGLVQVMRHFLSTLLAIYYIAQPHQAEEKVTRFRAAMTVEQLRAVWQKGVEHPVLRILNKIGKTKIVCEGLPITIEGVRCNLFYDKPIGQLPHESCIIIVFPGGGFLGMDYRNHADYLCYWAAKIHVPILAVNYRKAPEFPFPAGFDDCFDVYESIVESEGSVAGLNLNNGGSEKRTQLRIALVGDSAGGNLSAAVTLKAIENGVRVPDGVHLIYPVLDMHCELWRPSAESERAKVIDGVIQMNNNKSSTKVTRVCLDQLVETNVASNICRSKDVEISSRARYLFDGCLPTSIMVLICSSYLANGGDPNHHHISPLHASPALLAKFPPLYVHVGEVDPLFDDSIRFVGDVRAAHSAAGDSNYQSELYVIPKVSHAYMHIASLLHESREAIQLSESWLRQILKLRETQFVSDQQTDRMKRIYSSKLFLDKIENNPMP